MYTCRRKWQEWISLWIRSSSVALCAWKCCGSRSPFPADTVIVWSALKVTGGNVSWKRNTAALSADAPLVLNLCYVETPCWLMLWRNWGEPAFKMLVGKQRMSNVTFALGRNIELLGFVWNVRSFTARCTWNLTMKGIVAGRIRLLKLQNNRRRESVHGTINCGTPTVAQTNNAFVVCASKTDTRGTAWWRWWRRGWKYR